MRFYENVSAMTPEEKQKVQKSNNDCKRIEQIKELDNIISLVVDYFKNFRTGGEDHPMISIKGGRVEATGYYKDGDSMKFKRLLSTYPSISDIADQHLCILCYQKLKSQMPYMTFTFGNWWVSMEVYKK